MTTPRDHPIHYDLAWRFADSNYGESCRDVWPAVSMTHDRTDFAVFNLCVASKRAVVEALS